MQAGPVHEFLKPLQFIIGKWKSISAKGFYPAIEPFTYCEELEFSSLGQPILNYTSKTWHPTKHNPMHLESGFLRIKPDTNVVSLLVAHNFGATSLEEGCVSSNEMTLRSKNISRMSFAKEPAVLQIVRTYKFNEENGQIDLVVSMETTNTPLTEHLCVTYEKC